MSLLPMLYPSWWQDLYEPLHVPDQHFGLHPEHLIADIAMPKPVIPEMLPYVPGPHGYRPWWTRPRRVNGGGLSTVKPLKDTFQVMLDFKQFAPEEITVKVVGNHVIVEAEHDEKKDEHGWISRKFCRKYLIPEQCNMDHVESQLSSDGVLTINVPRKKLPTVEGERDISIQYTDHPAIQVQKPAQKSVEVKK